VDQARRCQSRSYLAPIIFGDYPLDTDGKIEYSSLMIGFKISIVDVVILIAAIGLVIGLIIVVIRKRK
jgi:hypothetical protein